MKSYFVILRGQNGQPLLMYAAQEDPHDDEPSIPALFSSENEAHESAQRNMFGATYGYEVYEWRHIP